MKKTYLNMTRTAISNYGLSKNKSYAIFGNALKLNNLP
jgi:hypothetical protein